MHGPINIRFTALHVNIVLTLYTLALAVCRFSENKLAI